MNLNTLAVLERGHARIDGPWKLKHGDIYDAGDLIVGVFPDVYDAEHAVSAVNALPELIQNTRSLREAAQAVADWAEGPPDPECTCRNCCIGRLAAVLLAQEGGVS